MQEEVENRSVNLAITSSKLTARTLEAVLKKLYVHQKEARSKRNVRKQVNQEKKPTGKQTVKELIAQNQGAQSIDISATDIKGFERYARKYGVDYAIKKDCTQNPPKYLVFFKARDSDVLTRALKEYTASVLDVKHSKTSVLKKLAEYKNLVAAKSVQVKEKIKEIGR